MLDGVAACVAATIAGPAAWGKGLERKVKDRPIQAAETWRLLAWCQCVAKARKVLSATGRRGPTLYLFDELC
jgi:hypothetical protein